MLLISIFIWVKFCNRNRVIRQNQELLRVLSFWNASAKNCEIMNELGFENAYNLVGGILEWEGEVVTP
jgi:rhodanese-related sulfurtransferase